MPQKHASPMMESFDLLRLEYDIRGKLRSWPLLQQDDTNIHDGKYESEDFSLMLTQCVDLSAFLVLRD